MCLIVHVSAFVTYKRALRNKQHTHTTQITETTVQTKNVQKGNNTKEPKEGPKNTLQKIPKNRTKGNDTETSPIIHKNPPKTKKPKKPKKTKKSKKNNPERLFPGVRLPKRVPQDWFFWFFWFFGFLTQEPPKNQKQQTKNNPERLFPGVRLPNRVPQDCFLFFLVLLFLVFVGICCVCFLFFSRVSCVFRLFLGFACVFCGKSALPQRPIFIFFWSWVTL